MNKILSTTVEHFHPLRWQSHAPRKVKTWIRHWELGFASSPVCIPTHLTELDCLLNLIVYLIIFVYLIINITFL